MVASMLNNTNIIVIYLMFIASKTAHPLCGFRAVFLDLLGGSSFLASAVPLAILSPCDPSPRSCDILLLVPSHFFFMLIALMENGK